MKLERAKVHFIGIGGIGMCGLAELLKNMGAQVTGSDLSANAQTERLKAMGVQIFIGHDSENVKDQEVVVYSSAIKHHNEEFQKARQLKIPLIARAEALAEIMRLKRGVAVGGTHGKTTTTSLLASVFLQAQLDPTVVVGGRLDLFKSTAKLGQGEWLLAEADESDGSFHRLSPENVVITNIDNDHLDHYESFENIQKAFYDFASRIPFYGNAVIFGDDPMIHEVFKNFPKKKIYYGFENTNDYFLKGEGGHYEVFHQKEKLGEIQMPLPGKHNALNSLAAIVSGHVAGIEPKVCIEGIESFKGVDRRFQHKAKVDGIDYFDDYGHHPTEVAAVLQAFKEKYGGRRLVVVFQPHRFSRTRDCWDDFLKVFEGVEELLVLDIYPAGESPIDNINSQRFCEEVKANNIKYLPSKDEAPQIIKSLLRPEDICLTLGAGDVWRVGEKVYLK